MIILLGLGAPAIAEPAAKDGKLEAKAHFMSGQSHYNLNEFPEALADFKDAYRLFPDPVFLYNLGQCERQLGHFEEAIRFYRSFLREQPKAANRQEVAHKIEEMEAAIKNRAPEPVVAPGGEPVAPPTANAPATGVALPTPTPSAASPVAEPAAPNGWSETGERAPNALLVATPTRDEASSSGLDLSSKPMQPTPATTAFYQHWWFWPAVAVVAIGAGVGIYAVTASKGTSEPTTDLGTRKAF